MSRKRSSTLRLMAYVYGGMSALSWSLGTVPEAYVMGFAIIGLVNAIGAEILKEFGR